MCRQNLRVDITIDGGHHLVDVYVPVKQLQRIPSSPAGNAAAEAEAGCL